MRRDTFEVEVICGDCGYAFTAEMHEDRDSGVVSFPHSCDENCAECGSANVVEVE